MYSLREEIARDGLDAVLAAVRDAGFRYVEFAGFYGMTPEALAAKLGAYGLSGMSAHIGPDGLAEALPYLDALGIKKVFIPWLKETAPEEPDTVKRVRDMADTLKARGVLTGYHNHAHEYGGGGDSVRGLLEAVPGLTAQLDVFWATAAGLEPAALMERYGARLACVHVKEMDGRTTADPAQYPNPVPGTGKVGMAAVFGTAKKLGVTDFVLEVEGFPFPYPDYLKQSYDAIKKLYEEKER
jgi:sugar phosphate isomerase/epimerase